MEILVAILLYLQLMTVGNNYSQQDIVTIVQANQPQITAVQSNPQLTNQAINQFGPIATQIVEGSDDPPPPPPQH